MPQLDGSCHCGAVSFSVMSHTRYPYMRCYCSICRKTDGGGGYTINLLGDFATLTVKGEDAITVYQAVIDGEQSPARRHFCRHCGTALYLHDPRWPDLVHPFASAVDTPLPATPETQHIMLDDKPSWVDVTPADDQNIHFAGYPDQSIEDWHKSRNLWQD